MTANPAALQLYTLREQLTADRPGVLAQVAALGYGAVEPFNILSDPDRLRADLDAAGLFACSVHAVPAGETPRTWCAPPAPSARTRSSSRTCRRPGSPTPTACRGSPAS